MSESAEFAEAVQKAGLVWIGPSPAAIRAMGDKSRAKNLIASSPVASQSVPLIPGYAGEDQSYQRFLAEANRVGYPGCKWRGLPKRFGNWHTIYTRMNRWTKAGVLDRMFEELQRAQVVRIRSLNDWPR